MATVDAGTVQVKFAAQIADFQKQLDNVQKGLSKTEASFSSFGKAANFAIGVLAGSAVVSFAKSVFFAADAMGDAAERAGIAADSFSRLAFAAGQSDVEFSELTIGIKNFQQNLSEARDGVESATRTFALLGIQVEKFAGLNLEQQLGEIADAFTHIADPADKTRIAVELFGKAGQALIPFLNQGAEGLAELEKKADELGITLSESTAKGIDEADKALKRLIATRDALASKVLVGLSVMILGPPEEVQQLDAEIDKLTKRIAFLSKLKLPTTEGPIQLFSDQLDEANRKLQEAIDKENELLGLKPIPILPKIPLLQFDFADVKAPSFDLSAIGKEEREAAEKARQLQQDIAIERGQQNEKFAEQDREFRSNLHAEILADARDAAEKELALATDVEERRFRLIAENEQLITDLKFNAFNTAIGLLQALGQRNKAFAIAALAFQTAMAVKQILVSTSVAAAAALEPPPIGAGPIAGIPLAASIKAWGIANAALTGALGIAQIANVASPRSGGTPLGSPANPIFTQGGGVGAEPVQAGRSVQIIFNGPIAGEDAFRDLIEDLFDRDVVVIGGNTRQAQVIRG